MKALGFAAALGFVMLVLLYLSFNPLSSGNPNSSRTGGTGCSSFETNFLIIANESGFNDSIYHGAPANPWPVMCVHAEDNVTITIKNTDKNGEPHGFAITQYYENGVAIAQGTSVTISFIADKPGDFVVRCNIFCSVHAYMVGELIVQ